jgi:hypothetical protein
MEEESTAPKAFLSYSWDSDEHRDWVTDLGNRLRGDGIDLSLDEWHLRPGDQLTAFMETNVRESDFVLIVCTPRYKERSDSRTGGVGYEGHIITAEILSGVDERKFLPLLRYGKWSEAAPSWLLGKYYLDLRGSPYTEEIYEKLVATLHDLLPHAPLVTTQGDGSTADRLSPEAVTKQSHYTEYVNAGLRVFKFGNQRLLLLERNDQAARSLRPSVDAEINQAGDRCDELLQEIHLWSSEEVRKVAGEMSGWILAGRISSMMLKLKGDFKKAHAKFIGEALQKFKEAIRQEAQLR